MLSGGIVHRSVPKPCSATARDMSIFPNSFRSQTYVPPSTLRMLPEEPVQSVKFVHRDSNNQNNLTIAMVMHRSSYPSCAAGTVNFAYIRVKKKMKATAPPPAPKPMMRLVSSRIGAPQAVIDAFFVAFQYVSNTLLDSLLFARALPSCSLIVQLTATHVVIVAANCLLVHMHA